MLNNSHQTPVEVPSGLSSVANAVYNESIEAEASSLPPRTKSQKTDGKRSGVGGGGGTGGQSNGESKKGVSACVSGEEENA